jgi:D-alanyl-D-alanine carboxypeptidase (penicillin-binding protein 5/6)
MPIPAPPQFDAKSYVLMDVNSGQIVAAYNQDLHRAPASLTKLMTAYVVFHALKDGIIHLDETTVISERAWRMGGSRMFAELHSQVSVDNLLQGMLVQSGNDATVALAERVAGSEDTFVEIMNQYASKLGMQDSHFLDASGDTDNTGHHTTARDLATLARAIITEFPQYQHYFSQKDFLWNRIHQPNRNDLLFSDPSVDGLKTGHTDSAGFCLAATANRPNMRLIAVVLDAKSEKARAQDAEALLNYGSNFFETRKLYDAGAVLAGIKVWKGAEGSAPAGVMNDFYLTIPKGSYGELHATLASSAGLVAPVAEHTAVGTLDISIGDRLLARVPVFTLKTVPAGNIFQRMFDSLRLWFKK